MEQQWQVMTAGWLATRWQSTPPNPRWPTATLLSATRLATSNSTPTCMFHRTQPHAQVSERWSVLSLTLSWQKKRVGVRGLHLPESQWRTGDCRESGLDSGQQRHPFWNCCQIPAWFQCIVISKKHLFNLLYNRGFLCPFKKKIQRLFEVFFSTIFFCIIQCFVLRPRWTMQAW